MASVSWKARELWLFSSEARKFSSRSLLLDWKPRWRRNAVRQLQTSLNSSSFIILLTYCRKTASVSQLPHLPRLLLRFLCFLMWFLARSWWWWLALLWFFLIIIVTIVGKYGHGWQVWGILQTWIFLLTWLWESNQSKVQHLNFFIKKRRHVFVKGC